MLSRSADWGQLPKKTIFLVAKRNGLLKLLFLFLYIIKCRTGLQKWIISHILLQRDLEHATITVYYRMNVFQFGCLWQNSCFLIRLFMAVLVVYARGC